MPDYIVKVEYRYKVQAIDPQDALSTVPYVIKARFAGFHGEGTTKILDTNGKVVLTAKLVTDKK